jgi:hypothetical protein
MFPQQKTILKAKYFVKYSDQRKFFWVFKHNKNFNETETIQIQIESGMPPRHPHTR